MNKYAFRGSKTNRDRREQTFAREVIAIAQRRYLSEQEVKDLANKPITILPGIPNHSHILGKDGRCECEKPLGTCEHCGADYFDTKEQQWHADAECVGAEERFR